MEKQLKIVAITTIIIGFVATLTLIISVFSSSWILGDLESTYSHEDLGSETRTVNTSGSCGEGVLLACCTTNNYTYITRISGYDALNSTVTNCYLHVYPDFIMNKTSAFAASRALSILALPGTFLPSLLGILFLCMERLHTKTVVPIIQMAHFFLAGFFFMIGLILMGTEYKNFTDLLNPTKGWSIKAGIVAEMFVLLAAVVATIKLIVMKRIAKGPVYGNF